MRLLVWEGLVVVFLVLASVAGPLLLLVAFGVALHAALVLNIIKFDLWSYSFCAMAMVHFYIHEYVRQNIIVSRRVTLDELWHIANMTISSLYLYSVNASRLSNVYALGAVSYMAMLALYATFGTRQVLVALYYLAAFLAVFLHVALESRSFDPLFATAVYCVLGAFNVFSTWSITLDNAFGNRLSRANLAGCSFFAEAIVVLGIQNSLL
eukprot:TRINITY_DN15166_c0_g1_i1.p1 TRINITY_DN15166_c0_g1~~TRINITY_DN15166_c0_g1_i1.p1  ORF type:complete len:210 (+),score=49.74 TRINITY_DN15166_c0_g1_i1:254-883(+)